jgi:hypothetical protein
MVLTLFLRERDGLNRSAALDYKLFRGGATDFPTPLFEDPRRSFDRRAEPVDGANRQDAQTNWRRKSLLYMTESV